MSQQNKRHPLKRYHLRVLMHTRAQYSWLGLFVATLFFAAISIVCVFIVWFLSSHADTTTSAATIAADRGLAIDIAIAQSSQTQFWKYLEQSRDTPHGKVQSLIYLSDDASQLQYEIHRAMDTIKTTCWAIGMKNYTDFSYGGIIDYSSTDSISSDCVSKHVVLLPHTFMTIGLDVKQ